MKLCTLASSSKGNSIIVYTEKTKILIDCGISLANLEEKMAMLNMTPADLDAVLVTHEHIDHVRGIAQLCKKYGTHIYCNDIALYGIYNKSRAPRHHFVFFGLTPFVIGDLAIQAFNIPHDVPCCGFNIENNEKKISILTDLGQINESVLHNLEESTLIVMEANHDIDMVKANTKYSARLKSRILGDFGHLSNISSAQAIAYLANNNLKQVVLAHLSEENNTPEICYNTIFNHLETHGIKVGERLHIDIANPYNISPVFVLK